MSHSLNLNNYYIKSYQAEIEAGIHFIYNTHKKRRFHRLFCKEFNIIIALIKHINFVIFLCLRNKIVQT